MGDRDPRPRADARRTAGPYRVLLDTPGVASQAIAGLLAQVTQAGGPVGMFLVVNGAIGSLAVAGGVVAGFSIGAAFARPIQGRAIDRRGPVLVLVASGVLHVAALVALVMAASRSAPGWPLVGFGCLAGVGLPPISLTMRVVWGGRTPAETRTAAYSLVYLSQELALLVGPLILGLLVASTSASTALLVVVGLSGVGTLAFVLLLGPGGSRAAPAAAEGVFRSRGLPTVLAIALVVGAALGAVQIGAPAFALAHGRPAASGVLVACVSFGGILGALIYGGRRWTAHPANRLVVLLALLSVTLMPLPALRAFIPVGAALFLVGLALNPAITTTSLLVDRLAPAAAAEAFGWISTALSVGTGAGNALAGVGSARYGASWSFVVASLAALAATGLGATTRRRLVQAERFSSVGA